MTNDPTIIKKIKWTSCAVVILICALFSCNSGDDGIRTNTDTTAVIEEFFPDSSNFTSAFDTIIFAQTCVEKGRPDIAERWFKFIINENRKDSCHVLRADSFSWLAGIERDKEVIDTNLIFAYMDSAHLACPYHGNSYMVRANLILDFGLDSVEYYLNKSFENGVHIVEVSGFVVENLSKIDTTKLNFDWMIYNPALMP